MRYNATTVTILGMLQLTAGAEHIHLINRCCNIINNKGGWSKGIIMVFIVIVIHVTYLAIRHMIVHLPNGGEAHFIQGLDLA